MEDSLGRCYWNEYRNFRDARGPQKRKAGTMAVDAIGRMSMALSL